MGRDLNSGGVFFSNSKQESYLVIRELGLFYLTTTICHLSPHLYSAFGRSGRVFYQIMSPQEMA